jgi:hypothetical protein
MKVRWINDEVRLPGTNKWQSALDSSVPIGGQSRSRVGIDYESGEFVVFSFQENKAIPGRGTVPIHHGHVRPWAELNPRQQAALRAAGMADKRGKILTGSRQEGSDE